MLAFPSGRRWRLLAVPAEQARWACPMNAVNALGTHGSLWLRQDGRGVHRFQNKKTPVAKGATGVFLFWKPGEGPPLFSGVTVGLRHV